MNNTTLATWAAAIWNTLVSAGVEPQKVFAKHNLAFGDLCDAGARISVFTMSQIWRDSVKETANEAFGLLVPAHCSSLTFHSVGIALEASASLREALKRVEKLSPMISDAVDIRCVERPNGDVVMRWLIGLDVLSEIADQAIDAFMLSWVLSLPRDRIQAIRMTRVEPQDPSLWESSFQLPLEYCAEENQIVFNASTLDAPALSSNPAIAMAGEKIALDYLQKMKAAGITLRVEAELLRILTESHSEPRQVDVASNLHFSTRQLQRKLADEGTSFVKLLGGVRHKLACSYLAGGGETIADVSVRLGFVDQSNFASAFRRWEGCSPREYRVRHK